MLWRRGCSICISFVVSKNVPDRGETARMQLNAKPLTAGNPTEGEMLGD
jgi:hypothetical protein